MIFCINLLKELGILCIFVTNIIFLHFQHWIANSSLLKKFFQFMTCKRTPKNKYKVILKEMSEDPDWSIENLHAMTKGE